MVSHTVLCFDFGLKRIGVAVGQTVTRSAHPLTVLKANQGTPNWLLVTQLIKEWQPDALVVGIPLNMDGSQQPISELAHVFAQALREQSALTVYEVDERLTTIEARATIFADGGYRALRAPVDGVAAQIILEDWLRTINLN